MDDWNKDDEVWKLLGAARSAEVPPFFARKVLRRIRPAERPSFFPPLLLRWFGAAAFALLVAGFFSQLGVAPQSSPTATVDFVEVFDTAAGLDGLVVADEVTVSDFVANL